MSLHATHRQMDWKRLTVEPHRQQRRHHDRKTYGNLVPMDQPRPDKTAPIFIAIAVIVSAYFIARSVM